MEMLLLFVKSASYSFISLFSIINPIGMAAIFYSLTKSYTTQDRKLISEKVFKYGTILLFSAFCIGSFVLYAFGIALYALQIAGGIIVFSSSWQLLNAKHEENNLKVENPKTVAFYPLTMPLTIGGGAITVAIALSANILSQNFKTAEVYFSLFGDFAGMLLIMLLTEKCYRYSDVITKKIGSNGITVMTKITAFLLIAISVGMVGAGIKVFLKTL